jgi:ArsR family transcriptional regulator, arsenate/arsenite/antimonite-responsive transcriptional repressor
MGTITAITQYSANQREVSQIAKAISHPARIAIIELLKTRNCTCNDIVNQLPIAQATVSQHLKELKKAKLINSTEKPPRTIYSLNRSVYSHSVNKLATLFN